jgi:hypothetical protein
LVDIPRLILNVRQSSRNEEFVQSVSKLIQGCFRDTDALPNAQRAIALEKTFWKKGLTEPLFGRKGIVGKVNFRSRSKFVRFPWIYSLVDLLLQQILLHFWFMGGSIVATHGTNDMTLSNVDCVSGISNDENLSEDSDSIRDHAGWAIKRARDVVFK